jgi:hypothetical protein
MIDELQGRLQAMNPEPFGDPSSDELADVLALIEARRSTMSVDEAPHTTRARAPMLRRPAVVVAGVMMFAILLIGGGVLLFGGTEGPVADTTPTTTLTTTTVPVAPVEPTTTVPEPATSTTTTIPPKPSSLEISWQRVPEQVALQDGWIAAAAAGDSGYVAVGGTVGCSDPVSANCRLDAAVWLSDDGIAWERIESESFRSDAVRETTHGTSLDGDQYMSDVAWLPAGYVAVGNAPVIDPDESAGYLDRPGIWVSTDGRDWELLPYDEELFAGIPGMWRVITFEGRYVALAGISAWLSDDGTNWERVEIDSSGWVADMIVWNDMLVAVGGTNDGRPQVWTSDDGREWSAVSSPAFMESSAGFQGVGGNADGLVAIATSPSGKLTAWRSVDGTDWSVALERLGSELEWTGTSRTAVSIDQGTGGIQDDLILMNGSAMLWGTADAGQTWYSAAEFDGGMLEVLASGAPAVFNTVNQVLVAGDNLLAFGKVVAWSGTEAIGGLCYVDPGDGSLGSCRADAAIWVGTWQSR